MTYVMKRVVEMTPAEAEARVREALAAEGFGVLTEIDVKETFREKLDLDFRPYRILGACNPEFAHRALGMDADLGALLPCNVVLYEGERPGTTVVAAADPVVQLSVTGRDDMDELASEVRERIARAVEAV